jgi:hypothetical protein
VEGFSGCPSAAELAASWGLDLRGGYAGEEEEDAAFFSALDCSMLAVDPDPRDLYVPCDPPASSRAPRRLKGDALCHQLAEMARRDREPQAHSDLSPSTPRRSSAASSGRLPDKLQAPPTLPPPPPPQEVPLPYTSLLMMATNCPELIGGGDRMAGDDEQLPWDCAAPSVPSAQVNYKTKSRQMGGKKKATFLLPLLLYFSCRFLCIAILLLALSSYMSNNTFMIGFFQRELWRCDKVSWTSYYCDIDWIHRLSREESYSIFFI